MAITFMHTTVPVPFLCNRLLHTIPLILCVKASSIRISGAGVVFMKNMIFEIGVVLTLIRDRLFTAIQIKRDLGIMYKGKSTVDKASAHISSEEGKTAHDGKMAVSRSF